MIEIGAVAPDFALSDQNGNLFQLSKRKCGRVLLSFHPMAWTGVCHDEMLGMERNYKRLADLDTIPFGISIDSVPSKKAWADSMGLKKLALLSDFWPHGEIARRYGVFNEADGFSDRANIIVNDKGKVLFTRRYENDQVPDIEEILAVLGQIE